MHMMGYHIEFWDILGHHIAHPDPQGFEYAEVPLLHTDEDHLEVLQVLWCHLGS